MKEIFFAPNDPYVILPEPTKSFVPDWYKKSKKFTQKKFLDESSSPTLGIKACVPFMDCFTTGYIAQTSQDIEVSIVDGNPHLRWPIADQDILSAREGRGSELLPIPSEFWPYQFVWRNMFSIKLPKGYSALLTHPLNRHELPFLTLSGILDGGTAIHPGQYPFFLKKDFEGVIPAKTPIFQIIPFKNERWKSSENRSILEEANQSRIDAKRVFFGWYKTNVWRKKDFI